MRPWQHLRPAGLDESRITLADWPLPLAVKRNAQAQPRNAEIVFYGREVSFAELDDASDRLAGWPAPSCPSGTCTTDVYCAGSA